MTKSNHLLVDDQENNRFVVVMFAGMDPFKGKVNLIECTNGTEAIQKFEFLIMNSEKIKSIIMDYEIPDMTGIDVLLKMNELLISKIGSTMNEEEIVCYLFSAHDRDEITEDLEYEGLSIKYMQKPIDKEKMKKLLYFP